MARGTTVRFLFLCVLLLALQLLVPGTSFATARVPQAAVPGQVAPEQADSGKPAGGEPEARTGERTRAADRTSRGEEVVTRGDGRSPTGPTAPPHTRDRHRVTTDTPPGTSGRAPRTHGVPDPVPVVPFPGPSHISRSPNSHTPAALQVFRH